MNDNKIEQYAKYVGVDLEGCSTRYEKICKFKSRMIYIFEFLTDEEKKEFYSYLTSYKDRNEFLSTLEYDEILSLIRRDKSNFDSYDYIHFLDMFDKENDKYNFILDLKDVFNELSGYSLSSVITSFNEELYKLRLITEFNLTEYSIVSVIKTCSDETKLVFLNTLSLIYQVELIKSFSDVNLIKEYAMKEEYSLYRSDLVSYTKDEDFITNMFNNIDSTKFRISLIEKVEDTNLKIKLIDLLDKADAKDFLLTNYTDDYNKKVSDEELLYTKVDENITIGVELECCNLDISDYRCVKKIFKEFECKRDGSVKSGFEITSPILHFNNEDMSKLKSVCELLKSKNFYTDSSCGGHIHIGADYFKTKEDYLMFLYIYSNAEDILYYITDKEGSVKRSSINKYAFKSKSNYINAIDNGVFNNKEFDINNIHDMFEKINETRYNGVNFKNVGSYIQNTIEFRMPNGEIEFKELILNIKLFSRLIEVSHNIMAKEDLQVKEKARHLGDNISEEEKLKVLLDMLFTSDEEKNLYMKRYYANKSLENKNIVKFLKSLKSELFKEEESTIIYDYEEHTLVKKSI